MKKVLMIALFLIATLLAACSSGDGGESSGGEESGNNESSSGNGNGNSGEVAAVVNGEEISQEQFQSNVDSVKQQYKQFGMDPSKQEDQIQQTAIDQLIGTELVIQKAEKADIEVTEEEVNKQFEQMKSQYTKNDQWEQFLKKQDMTEEEVKQELKKSARVQKYVDNNVEVPEVTDEEAKKQYDKMKEQQEKAQQQEGSGQQQELGSFDEMKDQLKQQLSSQKQSEAVNKHIEKLREDADITVNV